MLFRIGTAMYPSGAGGHVRVLLRRSVPILRTLAKLRTETNVKPKFETLREEHKLVARAHQAAQASNARRILLASPRSGDGKTHLADCIERYASVVSDEHFEIRPLAAQPWRKEQPDGYVWVDGVALLEAEGAVALTPAVRASLDGALLVARGMLTTREELRECADRLRVLGVPVLGGVWNEFGCPSPVETVRAFVDGLRSWPPKLPPGVFVREMGSSS